MRQIRSAALELVSKFLGDRPGSATQATVLDDKLVSQVLPVDYAARRGLTLTGSEGWFGSAFENEHAVAGALETTFNPWYPGGNVEGGLPQALRGIFDLWIYGAVLQRRSGAGTLDAATFGLADINAPAGGTQLLAFTNNNGNSSFQPIADWPLARWTGLDEAGAQDYGISTEHGVFQPINMRIRPGAATATGPAFTFKSTAGTAAATFQIYVFLGLFPPGLGQDIVT